MPECVCNRGRIDGFNKRVAPEDFKWPVRPYSREPDRFPPLMQSTDPPMLDLGPEVASMGEPRWPLPVKPSSMAPSVTYVGPCCTSSQPHPKYDTRVVISPRLRARDIPDRCSADFAVAVIAASHY